MKIRLNKFLSSAGVSSRRKAEQLIQEGRVEINGKTVIELGIIIDDERDVVSVDGEKKKVEKKVYYLLNKPKGFVTTTKDEKGRDTVMLLVPNSQNLFPVGRLDVNTTGALLLTNDGDLANQLLHPSYGKKRYYTAKLSRPLSQDHADRLKRGVLLEGRRSKFVDVDIVSNDGFHVKVSTLEGRNHFVKKMFESIGIFVNELHRDSFAGLNVKDMPFGSYRPLSDIEINKLRENK